MRDGHQLLYRRPSCPVRSGGMRVSQPRIRRARPLEDPPPLAGVVAAVREGDQLLDVVLQYDVGGQFLPSVDTGATGALRSVGSVGRGPLKTHTPPEKADCVQLDLIDDVPRVDDRPEAAPRVGWRALSRADRHGGDRPAAKADARLRDHRRGLSSWAWPGRQRPKADIAETSSVPDRKASVAAWTPPPALLITPPT